MIKFTIHHLNKLRQLFPNQSFTSNVVMPSSLNGARNLYELCVRRNISFSVDYTEEERATDMKNLVDFEKLVEVRDSEGAIVARGILSDYSDYWGISSRVLYPHRIKWVDPVERVIHLRSPEDRARAIYQGDL